jgi:predicted nucleic acid-binding protein
MTADLCVDASLIVALLLPEKYTEAVTSLWRKWIDRDHHITAPTLLGYEVTNAIYRKVFQGKINADEGQTALQHFLDLDIELVDNPVLHLKAIELATQFNRPNTYDAHYLALADHLTCSLWTADERLYNTVKGKITWVEWIDV